MIVKFKQWTCRPVWRQYMNKRVALQLVDADNGEAIATATVNVPHVPLREGEVVIKSYAENEGMVDALVAAGIIDPPHREVELSQWAVAHVANLNVTPE